MARRPTQALSLPQAAAILSQQAQLASQDRRFAILNMINEQNQLRNLVIEGAIRENVSQKERKARGNLGGLGAGVGAGLGALLAIPTGGFSVLAGAALGAGLGGGVGSVIPSGRPGTGGGSAIGSQLGSTLLGADQLLMQENLRNLLTQELIFGNPNTTIPSLGINDIIGGSNIPGGVSLPLSKQLQNIPFGLGLP